MRQLTEPYRLYYSPLAMGCMGTFAVYLGLTLFAVQGMVAPSWIWLLGLSTPLSSLVLQVVSRRVIYVRAYQLTIFGLITLVYGTLLWAVVTLDRSYDFKLFASLVIVVMLIALVIGAYRISQKRHQRAQMPYGPVGTLDRKTGLVDPTISPPNIQRHQDRLEKQSALLWRLAPLTAGLAMLLVRGLPASADEVLVAIVAFTFAVLGAGGAGGYYFYLVASRRWEQEHGKLMYVKR